MRRNRKILLCFLFLICLILAGTLEYIYQYGQSGGEKASADVVDGMNIIDDDYLFTGTPIRIRNNGTSRAHITHSGNWEWYNPALYYTGEDETHHKVHEVHEGWRLASTNTDGLANEGDWITVRYYQPVTVGGEVMDVEVTYKFTDLESPIRQKADEDGFTNIDDGHIYTENKSWTMLGNLGAASVPRPAGPSNGCNITLQLERGFTYYNIKGLNVSYKFLPPGSNTPIHIDGGVHFNWGSLNYLEGVKALSGHSNTMQYFKQVGAMPSRDGDWLVNYSTDNNWVDQFDSDSFWRSCGTVKVINPLRDTYTFKMYALSAWNAPSFGCVGAYAQPPTKSILDGANHVTHADRHAGQTLVYGVKQRVQTLGYNGSGMLKYSSFTFLDILPSAVAFQNAEVIKIVGNTETDVTNKGTLSYNSTTREVKFTFNTSYLQTDMDYKGETYMLKITTKVKDTDETRTFKNLGKTNICGVNQTTNYVDTDQTVWHVKYDNNSSSKPDHQTGEKSISVVTSASGMARTTYQHGVAGKLRKNDFKRTGYTFSGWNTKADGTGTAYADEYANVLDWTDEVDGVVTLYAQWTKKLGSETITVTDQSTGDGMSGIKLRLQKNVNGTWTNVDTYTTNSAGKVSLTGLHWFDYRWVVDEIPAGWREVSSDKTFGIDWANLSATNSIVLRLGKYWVHYEPNGSSNPQHQTGEATQNVVTGSMANSEYEYGTAGTLRKNAFARAGYTFAGWNTKADGTGKKVDGTGTDGYLYPDEYNNVYNWSDSGGTITLYAQWTKKLGEETIKFVSEETGNSMKGVKVELQKNVNGTWTKVTTETTEAGGQIKASNLHWFSYRWVIKEVPAGYQTTHDRTFTISHTTTSRSDRVVLYMKHVMIALNARVNCIIEGEDAPAFLYHISGNDVAGVRHDYNVMVPVNKSTKTGREQLVHDIFAGTYTITQTPVMRYVAGTAENVSHTTINGSSATVNVKDYESAEVRFPYTLTNHAWYSGVDNRKNPLRS